MSWVEKLEKPVNSEDLGQKKELSKKFAKNFKWGGRLK